MKNLWLQELKKKLKEYNQDKKNIDKETYKKIKNEVVAEWADEQMSKLMEQMSIKYDSPESRVIKKSKKDQINHSDKNEEKQKMKFDERKLKEIEARNNDRKIQVQTPHPTRFDPLLLQLSRASLSIENPPPQG